MFPPTLLILTSVVTAPMALAQTYTKSKTFTFTGSNLPKGLVASDYVVQDSPKHHEFVPQNVYVLGGYLNLLVNGGQQNDAVIWSGEVSTDFTVASARVETYAILTNVPGVCNGK